MHMDAYMDTLRRTLMETSSLGDERTQEVARSLTAAFDPALRLVALHRRDQKFVRRCVCPSPSSGRSMPRPELRGARSTPGSWRRPGAHWQQKRRRRTSEPLGAKPPVVRTAAMMRKTPSVDPSIQKGGGPRAGRSGGGSAEPHRPRCHVIDPPRVHSPVCRRLHLSAAH